MTTLLRRTFAATLVFCLLSCSSPPRIVCRPSPPGLETLSAWMTGAFSSAAQSEADPENYYEVRLVMFPIWTERDDGHWLYVEQAISTALEQPYRQRVYHLSEYHGVFKSAVFELPGEALDFAGAWDRPESFADFGPEQLVVREGCAIYLDRVDGRFAGATRAAECTSSLRGASYATSEVEVTAERLTSWDRGWDADGEQVWGATEGAYVFDRIAAPF